MLHLLWLVPVIPVASALFLGVLGRRLPPFAVAAAGAGSIAVSAAVSALVAVGYLGSPLENGAYTQVLWTWFSVGGLQPRIALYLDGLALVMILVVTGVGFLIHLYSTEHMRGEEGYSRFFAYMNLFVASMLTLVLAGNLLLLFLGWEGVGLCSYLLIGFWFQDAANGRAGQKAFIVTRVGDTAFMIGLFVVFLSLGTLDIQDVMTRAQAQWPAGSGIAIATAALLLGGAVGKSAQLPLQTWLPDAMAGPTPTSALIHAATMVTAGVYLIVRTNVLFTLAPPVLTAVAVVGAATMLMAGFSAITQQDIKRILAYSTISQIGYMFLALGVGAWSAAIFHFMTHAFFKALLFLAAGVVILAQHHEHNIFHMGGLKSRLPVAYWTFLIGGSSLAGLPLITSGFYSKDLIILQSWISPFGHPLLWIAGIAGVLITALYTFRLIFVVFFGEARHDVTYRPGPPAVIPLLALSVLSIVGGFIPVSQILGGLPSLSEEHEGIAESLTGAAAALAFGAGLLLAWWLYLKRRIAHDAFLQSPFARAAGRFFYAGWGFDWLYDRLFVKPVAWFARIDRFDVVDTFYTGMAWLARQFHRGLALTQTGNLRWYAAGIAAGSALFVAMVLFA